jgi:Protein of unknown function (DUF2934)
MAKPRVPKKQNGNASATTTLAASAPVADLETSATATAVAEPNKPVRKPAIVKTDGRANLFPINVEEEIRRLAYLLSERRGFEPGHEAEDWLTAEREIQQRYHQQSA